MSNILATIGARKRTIKNPVETVSTFFMSFFTQNTS